MLQEFPKPVGLDWHMKCRIDKLRGGPVGDLVVELEYPVQTTTENETDKCTQESVKCFNLQEKGTITKTEKLMIITFFNQ